jgi:hypothetical protein
MRFKIVACILLILHVFSFVLAAPVLLREVRDACADAVEGDEDVIIVSGKRAPRGYPYDSDSESDTEWWKPGSESPSMSMTSMTESQASQASSPYPKTVQWAEGQAGQASSPSDPKTITWGSTTKIFMYPKEPLDRPPGRDGYLAKVAAQTLPQKTQSNGFVSIFKTFFRKLSKLKFWRRFQGTVNTGT